MSFTITKEYNFSASHQLQGLPEDHPCSRLHGHNYKVIVELHSNRLDENNFLIDYREIDKVVKPVIDKYDHRHLNDLIPNANPTAEAIAFRIYYEIERDRDSLPRSSFGTMAVTVKETDKTSATFMR